jgi:hypothetical protein
MAIRVFGEIGDTIEAGHSLVNAAPTILRMHGVTAIHIGQHGPDSIETAETKLRPTTSPIHFVVLIAGIGVSELENVANSVADKVTGASAGSCEAGVYRLAYLPDSVG